MTIESIKQNLEAALVQLNEIIKNTAVDVVYPDPLSTFDPNVPSSPDVLTDNTHQHYPSEEVSLDSSDDSGCCTVL